MNPGKVDTLKAMLKVWREAANILSHLQWNCFYRHGGFDSFFDPATVHRKRGAAVRSVLLRQINEQFDVSPPVKEVKKNKEGEEEKKERKRLPLMIPGLSDPLAPLKAALGAAEVQMVREQVLGTLNSFISNRQNEFRQAVFCSTVSEETRHALLIVNKMKAWFDLKRALRIDGVLIDDETRRLARNIMSQIMRRHRKPGSTELVWSSTRELLH